MKVVRRARESHPVSSGPELAAKLVPVQARALDTVEIILETAGNILEEVGFEQLNTNLVAKRAEISIPALYRYFPNKYAILKALGDRIMRWQDEAVLTWLRGGGLAVEGTESRIASVQSILRHILVLTQAFPGNIAITRALRSVPAMRASRLEARGRMTSELGAVLGDLFPAIPAATLRLSTKLCLELIQASIDMVLEEPGPDTEGVLRETARAFVVYFENLAEVSASGAS